jgi:hypothetical protein
LPQTLVLTQRPVQPPLLESHKLRHLSSPPGADAHFTVLPNGKRWHESWLAIRRQKSGEGTKDDHSPIQLRQMFASYYARHSKRNRLTSPRELHAWQVMAPL